MLQHIQDDVLKLYYGGSLPEAEIGDCEKHLAECDTCRSGFAILVRAMDEAVSEGEASVLDRAEAGLPRNAPLPFRPAVVHVSRPWWLKPVVKLTAIAATLVLAAGAIWILVSGETGQQQQQALVSGRALEARISGEPYSEFVRKRQAAPESPHAAGSELNRFGTDPHEIGRFYLKHADITGAVVQLEAAEKAAPDSVAIHNDLGVAYMESAGDAALEKAVHEFQRALDLDSGYEPARFNLALTYEREGKFSEAVQQLQEYMRLDVNSGWANEARAKVQLLKH